MLFRSVFGRAGITRTAPPKDESPNDVPCGPRSTSIRSISTSLMSTLVLAAKPPEFVIGVSPKYVATVVPDEKFWKDGDVSRPRIIIDDPTGSLVRSEEHTSEL